MRDCRPLGSVRGWAVLATIGFLGACGEGRTPGLSLQADAVPEADRFGGSAIIAGASDLADLNPLTTPFGPSIAVIREMLFMPLVMRTPELEPIPYLARAWEVDADTTMLTLHLRDDVFWHDGVQTTAYDVKFSYELAKAPATGSVHWPGLTHFGDAEVVDSFTVRIRMQPHVDFLWALNGMVPLPRHILAGIEATEIQKQPFSRQPVGNGPFFLRGVVPGQSWSFEANDRFPAELGGRPYLDRITYRYIPESNTRTTELLTGGAQLIPAEPFQRAQLEGAGARVVAYRSPEYSYLLWNIRSPLFTDVRVRRALTLAIDRQRIVDGILYGAGEIGGSPMHPAIWPHDPTAGSDITHAPYEAKRLLAEAGWIDRNGNGIVEDATGRELRFGMMVWRGSTTRSDVAEQVASDLRAIGVVADLQVTEGITVVARLRQRDYEAASIVDAMRLYAYVPRESFHCEGRDIGNVHGGVCDPELDRLLDLLPGIVDRQTARPFWDAFQQRVAELQLISVLFFPHQLVGVSPHLQGVQPDIRGAYTGAARWWLSPEGRTSSRFGPSGSQTSPPQ